MTRGLGGSLLLGVLAACGTKAIARAPTGNVASSATTTAPPYASLFANGTREFEADLVITPDDGTAQRRPGRVTCTVSDVGPDVSDNVTMRLACDVQDFDDGEIALDIGTPSGAFSVRADGLWAVNEQEIEKLVLKLMSVAPVAGSVTQPPSEDAGTAAGEDEAAEELDSFEESVTNEPFLDGWCITSHYSMRRETGSWTLCFDANGIIGGASNHHGYGSTEQLTFGKAPE